MDLPVVNHEDYFAQIGDDHKFPINKFGELANYLIKEKIVKKFHRPYPCSEETLKKAHSESYKKEEFKNFMSDHEKENCGTTEENVDTSNPEDAKQEAVPENE